MTVVAWTAVHRHVASIEDAYLLVVEPDNRAWKVYVPTPGTSLDAGFHILVAAGRAANLPEAKRCAEEAAWAIECNKTR